MESSEAMTFKKQKKKLRSYISTRDIREIPIKNNYTILIMR